MSTLTEAARETPIVEDADVLVAGAGPAGVSAAVAAARLGARTRLLEAQGALGGIWTTGLLSWILDYGAKTGLMAELTRRLEARGAGHSVRDRDFICDGEETKLLLERMCSEANVRVQLHTRVVAASRSGDRLAYAVSESKSGRQAWGARVFVDATGDGDLAALAGCGYDWGHPETGWTQPFSMIALLGGPDPEDMKPFELAGGLLPTPPKETLRAEMERAGVLPSYTMPCLWHVRDRLYILMANHEYGYNGTDAGQLTEATFHAREELSRLVEAMRGLGGIWRNLRLVATAAQIGVREGRRIRGLYTVTKADLLTGARHEDAVCRVEFPIDVHSLDPSRGKDHEPENRTRTVPYDIPARALIAADARSLLMAGRCISGDFWAHSSYRVTGNAVRLGEAAGGLAALAAMSGSPPEQVPWRDLAQALRAVDRGSIPVT